MIADTSGHAATLRPHVGPVWPDDRFDVVWVLRPDPSAQGAFRLSQVPEMLLAGDRAAPIA